MPSTDQAKTAAMRILGCYPSLNVSDKQTFTAGLVAMLARYPDDVVARAADPSRGFAAHIDFPNLARFREMLDQWQTDMHPLRPKLLPGLPPVENTPEQHARIVEGFRHLGEALKANAFPPKSSPFPAEPHVRSVAEIPKLTDRALAAVIQAKRWAP